MPTRRTYRDQCPIARTLDVVGERWALLVVRELLLGPQRFSDLRRALPGASSNMLTDRLRELESHGVLHRRQLPPPAASSVYALTERGLELEPVLEALGRWGAAEPPTGDATLTASSVLLFLRGSLRAASSGGATVPTIAIALDDRVWMVFSDADGAIQIAPGEPIGADAAIWTDPSTLNDLVLDPSGLTAAQQTGAIQTEGDPAALRTLLTAASGSARQFAGS
jgi:DNA-binding HxlR family transcriptional regulator